ncbi:GntR family transcriptional regulator [Pseudonocardia acaciae]|uniref:GntR family transcriptional regulator n=1 Tax=Pseudonocardia acaciae TaxID=551276 RepID=UPI00068506EA|nr:GntR family transcriptional regulator [Pseudonocardia acaciae]
MPQPDTPPDELGRRVPRPRDAYGAIRQMIIERVLRPGEHLVEYDLAKRLGVSRHRVREALRRLGTDRWVDLWPAHGAFVHAPDRDEVGQVLAVRTLLEAECARLAAGRAGGSHLGRLVELCRLGDAARARGGRNEMVAVNGEFHAAVAAASGNTALARLAGQLDRRAQWYYAMTTDDLAGRPWAEHHELVDAIRAGRARLAAEIMRGHTERVRVICLDHMSGACPVP